MPSSTTKELTTLKIAKRYHHTIKSRFAIVNYATEHGIKGTTRGGPRPEDSPRLVSPLADRGARRSGAALSLDPSTAHCRVNCGVD